MTSGSVGEQNSQLCLRLITASVKSPFMWTVADQRAEAGTLLRPANTTGNLKLVYWFLWHVTFHFRPLLQGTYATTTQTTNNTMSNLQSCVPHENNAPHKHFNDKVWKFILACVGRALGSKSAINSGQAGAEWRMDDWMEFHAVKINACGQSHAVRHIAFDALLSFA